MQGDLVIGVANIKRATTNANVQELLARCIQNAKNCVLVCTHADDFGSDLSPQSLGDCEELKGLEAKLKFLNEEIQALEEKTKGGPDARRKIVRGSFAVPSLWRWFQS